MSAGLDDGSRAVKYEVQLLLLGEYYWNNEAIREIEEAIKSVKSGRFRRRSKRGYWTPSGFAWFSRKGKWCNNRKYPSKDYAGGLR